MKNLAAYIPMDRRIALAHGTTLPDRCTGAALFADISGFTPLTRAFSKELGGKRGAEALLEILNAYLATGHLERSAQLLGFLETGPAPDTTALYIRKIHAKLTHMLEPDVLRAALARGAARDLDDVAAELLQKDVAASS